MEREGLSVPETTRLLYDLRADGFPLPLDALETDACAALVAACLKNES